MRRAVLITLLLRVVSACAGQTSQAGQSWPPIYLRVLLRPGTGTALAATVLSGCRHEADVVRVGQRLVKENGD
jgi:hypothetical protein